MRTATIIQGYRCGKWVVVEDAGYTGNNHRVIIKCTACGKTKDVLAYRLSGGNYPDCLCAKDEPTTLPKNMGTACRARTTRCLQSTRGLCCFHCPEKEDCKEVCLNRPDLCGSYFLHPIYDKEEPQQTEPEQKPLMHYLKEV